jgi:hypothetical protein
MTKKSCKKLISIFLGLALLFSISACRTENEEDYFKKTGTSATCDTTYVTYTKQIKPLFDAKCVSCHIDGISGNCDLDTYEHTMAYIYSHQPFSYLYDYVKENNHEGVILDECELKQFSKWMLNPAP